MFAIVRARVFSAVLKRNSNRCFYVTVDPPKEPIVGSSSILYSQVAPPPTPPPPPPSTAEAERKPWKFMKYSLIAALTGGLATAGYATYGYNFDEIDEKTKAFRASANYAVQGDASISDKFQALIYSATLTVPVKLIEVYIYLRRSIEEQVRGFTEPLSDKLLPDLHPMEQHVFTLVLDLHETLIYSDWKHERGWKTLKRPGVDAFLDILPNFMKL